jgi:hypothetical protein
MENFLDKYFITDQAFMPRVDPQHPGSNQTEKYHGQDQSRGRYRPDFSLVHEAFPKG